MKKFCQKVKNHIMNGRTYILITIKKLTVTDERTDPNYRSIAFISANIIRGYYDTGHFVVNLVYT